MRFHRGSTFRDAIKEYTKRRRTAKAGPLELRRLISILVNICNAVSYAHSKGIVHRDLKPENVVLGNFGETILLDWGLAKFIREDDPKPEVLPQVEAESILATQEGIISGTPAYMAEEQANGRNNRINERTDVYGLGAILFEILTGKPPHGEGNIEEVLNRAKAGVTPSPRSFEPSMPTPLVAVCRKALARSQSKRYGGAVEFAEDIDCWLADEPVSAYRYPFLTRVVRWVKRHQSWVLAATASLVVITIVLSMTAMKLEGMADDERVLRRKGMHRSAMFAARSVGSEIELRYRILETAATSNELMELLSTLNHAETVADNDSRKKLQTWISKKFHEHSKTTRATSWFVTSNKGIQLARQPFSQNTLAQDFAFRDYFHGKGQDLGEDSVDLKPIREAHRSNIFKSQATQNFMVAFSVPVWSITKNGNNGDVIGVLAMTVELGRFGVLQIGVEDQQITVLIDTQPDATGKNGLVLHHPKFMKSQNSHSYYLKQDLVNQLLQLRSESLDYDNKLTKLSWEAQLSREYFSQHNNHSTEYRDPILGNDAGNCLAAFEPVFLKGRPDQIKDTGWVVIVHERPDPE